MDSHPSRRWWRRPSMAMLVGAIGGCALTLLAGAVRDGWTTGAFARHHPRAQVVAADRLQQLLTRQLSNGAGVSRPWPAEKGKRFVLRWVTDGLLDRRDPRALEVLFSPGDRERSLGRVGVEAFAGLSRETLRDPTLPVGRLTSYLGPRAGAVPDARHGYGTAVIADLSFPDVAIVGYTSGAVRILSRSDLGLEPSEPIVAGPKARDPDLRTLTE